MHKRAEPSRSPTEFMQSRSALDRYCGELVALIVRWLIIEPNWAKPSMGRGIQIKLQPWNTEFSRLRRGATETLAKPRAKKAEVRANLREARRFQTCQSSSRDAFLSLIP